MVHTDALWWQKGIVYQIYPRSFKDSDGDGIGDLAGITEKLDYVHWLGVDAIWISPIYPSPMADFGYDVSDYVGIHPMFGTMTGFDRLLEKAHSLGLKVILDFVPNHSSDRHSWFLESKSSRDNPKRDWYIWHDPGPNGGPPNNWVSVFGGGGWEWDEATGQYYFHSFLKEQPDLNWRNPEVQEAMSDVLRFWLEKGVDGVRIDVVFMLFKDAQLRDNPPSVGSRSHGKDLGQYDAQQHVYDRNQPETHETLRECRRLFDSYGERVLIGETHLFEWDELVEYYGQGDELHIPFNFTLIYPGWQAATFRRLVSEYEAALPPGAWPNYVLGCHDDHRIATRYGMEQARTAAMLLLTLRGTPTIYYGEEIGMTDVDIPPDKVQDPCGQRVERLGAGRDPERTPMQWDDSPNAGFTSAGVEPWLPVAPNYPTVNVAAERDSPTAMLTLYRRLIELRQISPALHSGDYHLIEDVPDDCYVYVREHERQRMLVALNFSGDALRVALGELGSGHLQLSTYLDGEDQIDLTDLFLRAHEGVLIELEPYM
jgi:alpha-glucosidase